MIHMPHFNPATSVNNAPPVAVPAGEVALQPSWASTFEPFSLFHVVTAVVFVSVIVLACLAGRANDGNHERRVRLTWVGFTVITQLIGMVWYLLPANFDPMVSYPLHVCDLAAWFVPLALLTGDHRARAMLYFWGIGLSSQAFFTPVLSEGYNDAKYWFFWLGHTQIIGGAVYDAWVRGYRPTLPHFRFAIIAGLLYTTAMAGFNEMIGANYCYVGRTLPDKQTILDALPPWPWRVLVLMALGVVVQFLALLPWLIVANWKATPGQEPEA